MEYKNTRNVAIFLTELKVEVQPFNFVSLTEEQIKFPSVQYFIGNETLVPFSQVSGVVLPPGVHPTPEEFGTVLVTGSGRLPGTAQVKTMEEAIVTGQQQVQKDLDKIGEDLKKK